MLETAGGIDVTEEKDENMSRYCALPGFVLGLLFILVTSLYFCSESQSGRYRSSDFSDNRRVDYNYEVSRDRSQFREDPYARSRRSTRRVSLHGRTRGGRDSRRHVSLH
jgi:hypothetical protein